MLWPEPELDLGPGSQVDSARRNWRRRGACASNGLFRSVLEPQWRPEVAGDVYVRKLAAQSRRGIGDDRGHEWCLSSLPVACSDVFRNRRSSVGVRYWTGYQSTAPMASG